MRLDKAVAQAIRELRTKAGLSQEELGLQIESNRTYVSDVERGISFPTIQWLFRVAKPLGCKPSQIIARIEKLTNYRI